MTTNMRNAVEQAAYEFGRAAAKYEMAIGTAPSASLMTQIRATAPTSTDSRKRASRVAKAASAPVVPKAPKVARSAKKATGPKTKGVKEGIMKLLKDHDDGLSTADVILISGFKATSVRAILMQLKAKGIAGQDDRKRWVLMPSSTLAGNSDHEAGIRSEYA